MVYLLLGRCLGHRYDGHVGAAFGFGSELNFPVYEREQRVIFAEAYIAAGVPRGAALTRQDIAGNDEKEKTETLATESTEFDRTILRDARRMPVTKEPHRCQCGALSLTASYVPRPYGS